MFLLNFRIDDNLWECKIICTNCRCYYPKRRGNNSFKFWLTLGPLCFLNAYNLFKWNMIFGSEYCSCSTTANIGNSSHTTASQTSKRTGESSTSLRLPGAFPKRSCKRELLQRNNSAEVLEVVENDPGVSTRRISVFTGESKRLRKTIRKKTDFIPMSRNQTNNYSSWIISKDFAFANSVVIICRYFSRKLSLWRKLLWLTIMRKTSPKKVFCKRLGKNS